MAALGASTARACACCGAAEQERDELTRYIDGAKAVADAHGRVSGQPLASYLAEQAAESDALRRRVAELEAASAPLLEWAQHGADDSRWRPGRTIEQSAVDRIAELEAELSRAVAAEREACAVLADTAAERAVAHVVALPIEAEYVRAWRAGSAAASSDLARDIRART